ncbi:MAG TPA: excisionase family DNA-binding protein [Terriglobales bacterium]|nr:excisionase family DNA-binding protein [Terriglobales bacterium]
MTTTEAEKVAISCKDQEEVQELYEKLRQAAAKLVGPDGKTQVLPNNLYSFLCRLLADLRAGNSVTILQSNAQLTTMEASKMLGTSRQFLVNLLEKGEIPFHLVGTHRRIYARDVLAYKAKRDAARRKALDDLARAEYDEGIYDKTPDDPDARQRVRRTA